MVTRRRLLSSLLAVLVALLLSITWTALSVTNPPLVAALVNTPHEPAQEAQHQAGKGPTVEPDLVRRLATSREPLHILVILQPSATDDRIALESDPLWPGLPDRVIARARFIQQRQQRLAQAVAPLTPTLTRASEQGNLLARRDLWLVNALALTARAPLVHELMASPAVAEIQLDHYRQYIAADAAVPGLTGPSGTDQQAEVAALPWGLAQIRAPEAWQTLEITGTGAVVAVMDTGVDWMHPALYGAYRGNLGKGHATHDGSWYDAVNAGVYPYDDHGHGTHVAGTAVGASTGVAPGAKWIAAKVLSGEGYGYDSWILSAFQWLLAPAGDPALAPDAVNASWTDTNGGSTTFLAAIETLKAAGILPIFAAGNSGPSPGTIGSPASNVGVFSVGASDPDDGVALFSARGPSPWGEIKPAVVAPGVNVVSSLPGGIYGAMSGTSMATPHVVGVAALMRAANPTLPVATMTEILTATSHPLTDTVPNNDSGWGRIDAFDALTTLVHPALISGSVREVHGGPVSGAGVEARRGDLEPTFQTRTDAQGAYVLAVKPGVYEVSAAAFGYTPSVVPRLEALPGSNQHLDFELAKKPTGAVQGQILVEETGAPPSSPVEIRALDTPVTTMPSPEGKYALTLPAGTYHLELWGVGYGVVTDTVTVFAGETTIQDFSLITIPRVLLVDEGAWYYESEISYWREGLAGLSYAYDEVTIRTPGKDVPPTATLATYDVVLWSSPAGSPGLAGAGPALVDYLEGGGALLLSGQDVAYFDGGGLGFWGEYEPYLFNKMGIGFVDEISDVGAITGQGPFDGLQLTLNGPGSADNQVTPDVVSVRDPGAASPVWLYKDQQIGGVATEICVPFRSLFFGFGYEGIQGADTRREVLSRGLDWLTRAPLTAGLVLSPATDPVQVGLPGQVVTHVVEVRHIAVAGITETISLSVQNGVWPASVLPERLSLGPCTSALVTATVSIPPEVGVNVTDRFTLSATSDRVSIPTTLSLSAKTPAPVLLVDDDRWYPMETRYIEALSAGGIRFDLWDTQSSQTASLPLHSPPTTTLEMYPIVVWFTGYDWYAPILPAEAARLVHYLDGGGRLLLSSQHFVDYHEGEPLADYLGIRSADWTHKATHAQGVSEHPAGGPWGPIMLDYPYPNWSYAIESALDSVPIVRGQLGQPIAIARERANARTLFYAFGLEALPATARAEALARGVGWLSPLGTSEWTISPTAAAKGDQVAFTLGVRNSAPTSLEAEAVHQVPRGFRVVESSLSPGLTFDARLNLISWRGTVEPGVPVALEWTARLVGNAEEGVRPTVTLTLPAWGMSFMRDAPFYGAGPDLTASGWAVYDNGTMRVGTPLSLTFLLRNQSTAALDSGSLSFWLMRGLTPITATEAMTRGLRWDVWEGALPADGMTSVTVPIKGWTWDHPLRLDALIEDGAGTRWERLLWLQWEPWRRYLPIITKDH